MISRCFIICVALLAGAVTSSADIIYSSTNFILGDVWLGEEFFDLDVDSNGTIDFSLVASLNIFSGISPEAQNKYLIHPAPPPEYRRKSCCVEYGVFY